MKLDKELLIIAGPNGSGKSTLADLLLEKKAFLPYVNADVIAKGLSGSAGSDIAAGRTMIERLNFALLEGESLAFETTLSGRSWIKLIRSASELKYSITLGFIAVHPVEVAISRVKKRVLEGGHSIPEEVIRRRYPRSLNMFFKVYKNLVNQWFFFDNTEVKGNLIAYRSNGNDVIVQKDLYEIYQRAVS